MNKIISIFLTVCLFIVFIIPGKSLALFPNMDGSEIAIVIIGALVVAGILGGLAYSAYTGTEPGWIKAELAERNGRQLKIRGGAEVLKSPNIFIEVIGGANTNEEYWLNEEKNINSDVWYKISIDRAHLKK